MAPATAKSRESSGIGSQRQGGNGHGDVVRLRTGISSRGVKCAARKDSVLPPRSGPPGRGSGIRFRKPSEPQDRQRDATSPRPPSGGNRRGGAKPRGWNRISRMAPRDRSVWRHTREWTLGRTRRHALARVGSVEGNSAPGPGCGESRGRERNAGRIPREEVEFDQGSRYSSVGEPRPEGLHDSGSSAREGRDGAVPSEDLEGQRGDAQGPGGSGEGPPPATTTPRSSLCRSVSNGGMPGP